MDTRPGTDSARCRRAATDSPAPRRARKRGEDMQREMTSSSECSDGATLSPVLVNPFFLNLFIAGEVRRCEDRLGRPLSGAEAEALRASLLSAMGRRSQASLRLARSHRQVLGPQASKERLSGAA